MVPQSESSRGEYRRSLDASNCEFEHTDFATRVSFPADAASLLFCRPITSLGSVVSNRVSGVFLRQFARNHSQRRPHRSVLVDQSPESRRVLQI